MEKLYQLTINFKVSINEDLRGEGTWKKLEHTRRFVDKIKSDSNTLLHYYKYRAYNHILDVYYSRDIEEEIKEKTESEILLSVLPELPAETAAYIINVFACGNGLDMETCDRNSSLIFDQFGCPEIAAVDFREVSPGKSEKGTD